MALSLSTPPKLAWASTRPSRTRSGPGARGKGHVPLLGSPGKPTDATAHPLGLKAQSTRLLGTIAACQRGCGASAPDSGVRESTLLCVALLPAAAPAGSWRPSMLLGTTMAATLRLQNR